MPSSVNLGERLEAFIDTAVKKGRYGSRSEVLREGVRLVQEREAKWASLEAEIGKAVDSLDRGETIPLAEGFDRARAAIEGRTGKGGRKGAA